MTQSSLVPRVQGNSPHTLSGLKGMKEVGIIFFFFLRKISPELTSAANPPLFAEEDWP